MEGRKGGHDRMQGVFVGVSQMGSAPTELVKRGLLESHGPEILHQHLPSTAMPSVSQYQQSSTRRLAFGGVGTDSNERMKKQLDFYKNTTLTNLSKLFCAIVLVTAFFLVMSRSFNFEAHFPD
ncbi:unnamed protein product, partial [Mesorhabditis spiculigera]